MASLRRRDLLRSAAAIGAATTLSGCRSAPAIAVREKPSRVVFLRFGGGVRRDDVFGSRSRCLAPSLRAAAAEGVLFSNLRNSGLTRHDCATRYLLSGRYGKASDAPEKATLAMTELTGAALVHEVFRRTRQLPQHKALVVGLPEHSTHPLHGAPFRAASFAAHAAAPRLVPYSLDPALPDPPERKLANERLGRLALALSTPDAPVQLDRRRRFLDSLVEAEMTKPGTPSPALTPAWKEWLVERAEREHSYVDEYDADALLTDLAIVGMRTARPDFVAVGFVTPDLAHRGSWREYAAAVRNADHQVQRVLEFVARDPYYRDRTLVLVATDTGRGEADFTEHERAADDPAARDVFLVAWGATARGKVVERTCEQTAVAPTIAAALGFQLAQAEAEPLPEVAS